VSAKSTRHDDTTKPPNPNQGFKDRALKAQTRPILLREPQVFVGNSTVFTRI